VLGSRLLAISIGAKSTADMQAALARAARMADVAELRVDLLDQALDLPALLKDRPLPVIVTDRAVREGGRSPRSDAERVAVLRDAAGLGAEFVDLEWDTASPDLVRDLQSIGTRVIVSRHAFDRMPDEIEQWAAEAAELGADVVKVVGMARDPRDVLPILRILRDAIRPTIAIAMDEAGIASRVLALRYEKCLLTFAALDRGSAVAPGQLPIDELRDGYNARRIGSATEVFGVLASRRDDLLVRRFNAWFMGHGLDAVAIPFVATGDALATLSAFGEVPVSGWYVPDEALQRTLAEQLSSSEGLVQRQERVNSVSFEQGRPRGSWQVTPSDQVEAWAAAAVR
jgi:3-dehydroquinate dehydratase type I